MVSAWHVTRRKKSPLRRVSKLGPLPVPVMLSGSPYHADDHCVGQVYAELYLQHKDSAMIAPMRARFDWILAHTTHDNLSTDHARNPDAGTGWW